MHKRRMGFIGILLSLVFVLAACTASATTTIGQNAQASPSASPTTANGQTVQTTNLATAMRNLEDLNSYVMTIKFQNMRGNLAMFTGTLPEYTVRITRNGSNRHFEVMNSDGNTSLQAWIVDNEMYVSFGSGNPIHLSRDNALVKQITDAITMDQMYYHDLQSQDANYQVIGTDTVNSQQTKVETAAYHFYTQGNNSLFSGLLNGTVESKIWVEMDNNYLVRGDFIMEATASANRNDSASTPASGTTVNGTPLSQFIPNQITNVSGRAEVVVSVSNVNNVSPIAVPGS